MCSARPQPRRKIRACSIPEETRTNPARAHPRGMRLPGRGQTATSPVVLRIGGDGCGAWPMTAGPRQLALDVDAPGRSRFSDTLEMLRSEGVRVGERLRRARDELYTRRHAATPE